MADLIYTTDHGWVLTVECNQDISTATKTELQMIKPSGDEVTWTATINGSTKLQYTIQDDDMEDEDDGVWVGVAYVEMPNIPAITGNEFNFRVRAKGDKAIAKSGSAATPTVEVNSHIF